MIVKTSDIETATAVIPLIPVPAQMIKIGAKAVFGNAFRITKKGSLILDNKGNHQIIIAIIIPHTVPIINPRIVSNKEIPI